MRVRLLQAGDEEMLDAFLEPHTPQAYFLRSNLLRGGIIFQNLPYQAEYFGAFDGKNLAGVVSHAWLGALQIFVSDVSAVAPLAKNFRIHYEATPRDVTCVLGAAEQAKAFHQALGINDKMMRGGKARDGEGLFTLDLAKMKMPVMAENIRRAEMRDVGILVPWRRDYFVEALGDVPGEAALGRARDEIMRRIEERDLFVLEDDSQLVSFCGVSGFLPDWKIVGPVWTPPALRGRGYGRAVTAGALIERHREGASHAVLFTDVPAAEKAYRDLGFERIGEWAFNFLATPRL